MNYTIFMCRFSQYFISPDLTFYRGYITFEYKTYLWNPAHPAMNYKISVCRFSQYFMSPDIAFYRGYIKFEYKNICGPKHVLQ